LQQSDRRSGTSCITKLVLNPLIQLKVNIFIGPQSVNCFQLVVLLHIFKPSYYIEVTWCIYSKQLFMCYLLFVVICL